MNGYTSDRWTQLICRRALSGLTAALLLLNSSSVRADDPSPASKEGAVPEPTAAAAESTAADESPDIDPEQVAQWVRELDADRYSIREAAQKRLAAVGTAALDPVAEVAATGSLESATRAVNVLMQWAESRDKQLSLAALERIAALKTRPAESAMASERLAAVREAVATEAIRKLGGHIDVDRVFGMMGRTDALQVIIGTEWKGGVEGLEHIAAVRNVTTLSLHSAPLDVQAIPELLKLNQLKRMELYGVDITADAVAKQLKPALPHVDFDVRPGGARLGIRGLDIQEVVPDSPAEKAGLVINDRITEFAGTPIQDFEQLTREIARCKPGDTVDIKVLRGGETIDKKVTFDRWGDDVRTKLNGAELQQGAMQIQLRRNGGRIIIQQGGQIIPVQPGQPIQIRPVPAQQQRR